MSPVHPQYLLGNYVPIKILTFFSYHSFFWFQVVDGPEKAIKYLNPMGELKSTVRSIEKNWRFA